MERGLGLGLHRPASPVTRASSVSRAPVRAQPNVLRTEGCVLGFRGAPVRTGSWPQGLPWASPGDERRLGAAPGLTGVGRVAQPETPSSGFPHALRAARAGSSGGAIASPGLSSPQDCHSYTEPCVRHVVDTGFVSTSVESHLDS